MNILETEIQGVYIIENFVSVDERGSFCKTYNQEIFEANGIHFQHKESFYTISKKDVIRGMHFQLPPAGLDKIVCVPNGKILDVVLDLRKDSPTYQRCVSIDLSSDNRRSVYIPKGLAHGFKALENNSMTVYAVSRGYHPECDTGIKWDSFGFDWGINAPIMSERDRNFVTLRDFSSPF